MATKPRGKSPESAAEAKPTVAKARRARTGDAAKGPAERSSRASPRRSTAASATKAASRGKAGSSARAASAAGGAAEVASASPGTETAGPQGIGFALPEPVRVAPERIAELQAEYLERLKSLMSGGPVEPKDRRFSSEAWRDGPFGWTANLYLLNAEFMQKLADSVDGDKLARERISFATQQWIDAMSPANYLATNPEAQRRLVETRGESLMHGVRHMLDDMQRGRIAHTDESVFEVGVNMATTPGHVVYQNQLFQLIQYTPTTAQVGRRPLLMVPPCINKYYILDLQPSNSLVAWAVGQGHTVFLVSWKNAKAPEGHLGWDDYLESGAIEAIRVVREIADVDRINTLGFCVGGTILASAAAVLAARGEKWIESMTLLTTMLDFSHPGTLGLFIDEPFCQFRERTIGNGGILPGRELATTFNYLRPNDLIWNYVVSKYLKGESPPPFDLLYWNADSTNLPGPMFCWYIRHMYLQNELRIPNRLESCGVKLDLGSIGVPTYIFASREDHIVPWIGAYLSTGLLKGENRFVLGASGHIAGVINPPAPNKRSHWTNEDLPADPEDWFEGATEHKGSWWPDWGRWLSQFSGGLRSAPAEPGNDRYQPIEPAPGSYVKEKAE